MTTDKVGGRIARIALKRSTKLLSRRARELVAENFCIPGCGSAPEGEFCPVAHSAYRLLLSILVELQSGKN